MTNLLELQLYINMESVYLYSTSMSEDSCTSTHCNAYTKHAPKLGTKLQVYHNLLRKIFKYLTNTNQHYRHN